MAEHKLSILVEALGTATANKKLKGVDATISRIGAKGGQGLRTAASNLMTLGTVAAGAAAVGLVGAVKAATDFQAQLQTINTVAMASPQALDEIGGSIRKIARTTGTSLSDLTAAYYDLVSAGIKPGVESTNVLVAANQLAIGGLATTAQTVDLLTTAINSYGGDTSKATEYADVFAKSIERGKVTGDQIAETFAQVGPLAASYGITVNEIAAAYAHMTAKGFAAEDVTTDMRQAMVALAKPSSALEKLEKQTQKNYLSIAGKQGLVVALQQMGEDAKKAGANVPDLLGRVQALQFYTATTGDELQGFNADLQAMNDAQGTAARQMNERQKGLLPQLQKLKALAIDAGITIGDKLLPKITPLAERAVAFLNTHQSDISAFGDKIAAGFDKALAFAQKIPWDAIGQGLQTAAEWGGKLMDLFISMPPEVQSTIIALAGLNKLSGGAITGIVGELGKGLIKGVLGINAGVVNVRGAVVNGGGGLPGGAGAGAGTAATGGGFLAAGAGALTAAVAAPFIMNNLIPELFKGAPGSGIQPMNRNGVSLTQTQTAQLQGLIPSLTSLQGAIGKATAAYKDTGPVGGKDDRPGREQVAKLTDLKASSDALKGVTSSKLDGVDSQIAYTTNAVRSSADRMVAAISAAKASVMTTVNVNVSAAGVSKSVTTQNRYGPAGGSRATGATLARGNALGAS